MSPRILYIMNFFAIYNFPILGFQGPLRIGSEEESMRYVLNWPLVCEKPRKNVVVGFNVDAFSISFIWCHFVLASQGVSLM